MKIIKNSEIEIKDVTVYNLLGQTLIKTEKKSETNALEIPFNVPHGAYIVKVNTDKGITTKKIIKD